MRRRDWLNAARHFPLFDKYVEYKLRRWVRDKHQRRHRAFWRTPWLSGKRRTATFWRDALRIGAECRRNRMTENVPYGSIRVAPCKRVELCPLRWRPQ